MTASTKDGATTSYEYAGGDMNKLLWQSTDGGAEYGYTYGTSDSNGVPVVTSRNIAGTGTASVISDPSTGQPLDLQTTDGTTSMWVIDGTGSPAAAIADTGKTAYTVSYDPYGVETVKIGGDSAQWQQNPYGFRSGLRSSSTDNGLTKFGYRWQSSVTGGWIERDTLDAPLSPTNANRYAYAGDDPINAQDPSGRVYGTGPGTGSGYCSSSVSCYSTPGGNTYSPYRPSETQEQILKADLCFASLVYVEVGALRAAGTLAGAAAKEIAGEAEYQGVGLGLAGLGCL